MAFNKDFVNKKRDMQGYRTLVITEKLVHQNCKFEWSWQPKIKI